MDLKELLEYLDIDSPEDLEYFENMADMMESDEEIPVETLKELFSDADMEQVSGIISEYFEDILEHVPDEAAEIYSLLNTVRLSLAGMAKNIDDDDEMFTFAEEFERVHQWYAMDSVVKCTRIEGEGADLTEPVEMVEPSVATTAAFILFVTIICLIICFVAITSKFNSQFILSLSSKKNVSKRDLNLEITA